MRVGCGAGIGTGARARLVPEAAAAGHGLGGDEAGMDGVDVVAMHMTRTRRPTVRGVRFVARTGESIAPRAARTYPRLQR